MTKKKDMDRVCGMWVEIDQTRFTSVYKGETYYFCEESCKKKFDGNPEHYLPAFDGRTPESHGEPDAPR